MVLASLSQTGLIVVHPHLADVCMGLWDMQQRGRQLLSRQHLWLLMSTEFLAPCRPARRGIADLTTFLPP